MARIPTRLLAVTAAVGAAVALTAAPAHTKVLDEFSWPFEQSGSFDDCGFTIDSQSSASRTTVIRAVRGTDHLWFASIAIRSRRSSRTRRAALGSKS